MKTKVWSFDVFDTVLCRALARPEHLFSMVAEKALAESGKPITQTAINEIARLRMDVEERTRLQADAEDISLPAVYEQFSELTFYGIAAKTMLKIELELEYELVYPITEIVEKIQELRQANKRIVFISDMYLPASNIRRMLDKFTLIDESEALYVSGDSGLTKARGTLFDLVCQSEGIKSGELYHTGDNELSDILAGVRRGVKVVHYTDSVANRYEISPNLPGIPFWQTSQLVGAVRATRLETGAKGSMVAILSGIVGPLLYSFVRWVLRQNLTNGNQHLFFVSRDGQILHSIAETIIATEPEFAGTKISYLYGSRQAWFLPSVYEFDERAADWLFVEGHSATPKALFAKLNISRTEAEPFLQSVGLAKKWERELTEADISKLEAVLFKGELKELILKKAAAARKNLELYLKKNEIHGDLTLVDIGWTLKTQRAIGQIVNRVNGGKVVGYYLGLLAHHLYEEEVGSYSGFFNLSTEAFAENEIYVNLFRHCNLIEQVFTMADHGSVYGYSEEGEPLKRDEQLPESRSDYLHLLRTTCLYFTEKMAGVPGLNERQIADFALSNFWRLTREPSRSDARALSWVEIGDDQNENKKMFYIRRYRLIDLVDQILFQLTGRTFLVGDSRFRFWPKGSVALTWLPVRLLYHAVDSASSWAREIGGGLLFKVRYMKAYIMRSLPFR